MYLGTICVLIDGTINLLWKINFTNVLIDVPKYLDINQKMEKSGMCENSLDENILIPSQLQLMEHEEIACVLIVGSINLLWKINLTNVLVARKKK